MLRSTHWYVFVLIRSSINIVLASAEIEEEKPECKDTTTTCQLWRTMCSRKRSLQRHLDVIVFNLANLFVKPLQSQKIVAEKCPLTCGVCQATPTAAATTKAPTTMTTEEVTRPTEESTSFSCIDNPVCKR
jgi:hypothetical protein